MKMIKGFSLIELIATIMIIGITVCLVLPRFFDNHTFIESSFNKKLLSSILFAQKLAMYSGCHIAIFTSMHSIDLYVRDGCKSGNFVKNVVNPNDPHNRYQLFTPHSLGLISSNFPMYFDHNGQARSVATDLITDLNLEVTGGQFNYSININGFNGNIETI